MANQLQPVDKIMPEDVARTFEAAIGVIQGKTERMDDLLKHGGTLLRKATKNFKPTQLVLGIAALAAVAIVVINRVASDDEK